MYINLRKYIQKQEEAEPYNQHRLNILLPTAGTTRAEKNLERIQMITFHSQAGCPHGYVREHCIQ